MQQTTRSVFAAIVGRPNVGKSSLTNYLVGEKVAIVTSKPQTTRTRITGILTRGPVQYVFLDTPGLHKPRTRLGERMAKSAKDTMADGDVVVMLFEPLAKLTEVELEQVAAIKAGNVPALAAVNKADAIADRASVEERAEEIRAMDAFGQVFLLSAKTGEGCEALLEAIAVHAVEGPHYFAADAYTDQPEKQLVAEIVREKLLLHMQEEIPHGTAVEVERFKERPDKPIVDIDITIYCEKKSHKGMIIGKGGSMLKKIASEARADCEELLQAKVHMQCWVKVKNDWRDNEFLLNNFGFKK